MHDNRYDLDVVRQLHKLAIRRVDICHVRCDAAATCRQNSSGMYNYVKFAPPHLLDDYDVVVFFAAMSPTDEAKVRNLLSFLYSKCTEASVCAKATTRFF